MSQTFGGDARRLAGVLGRRLGWPPHWFWQATPDEVAAILAPPEERQAGLGRADLERMMEQDEHG